MIRSENFSLEERRALLLGRGARLCFLGIGGVSMYALALLAASRGISVFGQDLRESERTRRLCRQGIEVFIPSAGAAVEQASALVVSLAVGEEDADLLRARARGIPVFTRADFLGALMAEYKISVAVSGSHGKSTVSGALFSVLRHAGLAPTALSGADLPNSGESFFIGGSEYLVAEACEYGDSFLHLSPSLSLFLNLEWDHPDYFPSEDAIVRSFSKAAAGCASVIYNAASPLLCRAIKESGRRDALSVGQSEECDFFYETVSYENGRATVRFSVKGGESTVVLLSLIGRFQAENAAMVLAAAAKLGVPLRAAGEALSAFQGIGRRLSLVGGSASQPVYYDYAHHPTEIRAGIEALRARHGAPITVLFRPHTFSRTAALFSEFASALSEADRVYISEIDGAREQGDGEGARRLAAAVGGFYLPLSRISELAPLEGPIVLMGAGDLSFALDKILDRYGKKIDKENFLL